jgi:hypothetical protein
VIYSEEYSKYSNTVPIHYITYPDFSLSYSFDYNHGYAALRLIRSGAVLADANGFDIVHCVNYDYVMDDYSTLENHSNSIETESWDVIAYQWNPNESINSGLFSANVQSLNLVLYSFNSKERYFSYDGKVILEDVIYSIFNEHGLKINVRNIEEIKGRNLLNCTVLSTYPQIVTKLGQSSYLYLGEDDADKYICVMGSPGEPLIIEINDESFEAKEYPMLFIRIPDALIENGFSVNIPELGIIRQYDRDTKRARCDIRNKELILEKQTKEFNK